MSKVKDIVIPEGWVIEKIWNLWIISAWNWFPEIYQWNLKWKYPFYKVSDTNNLWNEKFLIKANNYIDDIIVNKLKWKIFNKWTIVYPKVWATLLSNKRRILKYNSLIDNNLWTFNIKNWSNIFLYYIFLNIDFWILCWDWALPSISWNTIWNISILLPQSLKEQQKIAEILSTVDEAIEKTDKLIEKYKKIKTWLMEDLFTKWIDVNTWKPHTKFKESKLGLIPESWEIENVINLMKITTWSKNTQDKIENWKYDFYVRSDKIEKINTYSFDWEWVITSWDWVWVWKIYHYVNWKFDFHQRVYLMHCFNNKIIWKYFFSFFKTYFKLRVDSFSAKTTVDSVRLEMISEMLIPIPNIQEQQKIVSILTESDNKIEKEIAYKNKLEKIKKWLMNDLLTGKVRMKY